MKPEGRSCQGRTAKDPAERADHPGKATPQWSDADWATGVVDRLVRDTLARNVRQARERAGLSQEELADASYLTRETIARLEAGREPKFVTMYALSHALRVPLHVLQAGLPEGGVACCDA